jgi:hypothetical protein
VKIKIVLLFLFLGGGIFYGLKVWQGTALGCPEPLIQEVVKHHDHDNILPYHGYIDSYPGNDISSVYSLTPGPAIPTSGYPSISSQPYSAPSYLPPDNQYLPPDNSPSAPSGSGDAIAAASGYQSLRYKRDTSTGRQITEETQNMFSEMLFTFLGVNTEVCRKRFVCELEFRNPQLRNAIRFIG